ncbi:dynamin family protein [Alicyclobacillus dauci]|uniref:Dynamin family protein n=1 Tax=Alicyclobacillus dauci TaxID=1475485 RepID=A0ABY6YYY2_9BACL|nr:dynamin family protein [Alicyclobacillus dauci]WAH35843.1 dynamin family protein [Alicyclobacillus dauci]
MAMRGLLESDKQIRDRYGRIEKWIVHHGNPVYATRIRDVLTQVETGAQATTVAFCGLFSAGKSSLINALCEVDRLATGAVPTTADVATVALPGTDGQVVLLDTPGVDSTDESHREATMNALYRADVIVLVADYQHVEAEENLELLRSFSDEGKRLLFVVNQVDKHLDFELSFEAFQSHVEEALEDYGIEVEHVFYTSTAPSKYSQLANVRDWLRHLASASGDERLQQVEKRLQEIVVEAVHDVYGDRLEQVLADVSAVFGQEPLNMEEAQLWLSQEEEREHGLNDELQTQYQADVESRNDLREKWIRQVELAQIAPYETTEKGRVYVESLRPEFKVGFLLAAKKTEQERERRAQDFVEDIASHVQNYLLVPLRNQVAQDLRQVTWGEETFFEDLSRLNVKIDVPYVKSLVKTGALVSSQYPYQYVKDVVARVKRDVLGQLMSMIDNWFAKAKDTFFANHLELQQTIDDIQTRIRELNAYLSVLEERNRTVRALIAGEVPSV